jgi:hypothetical protein
MKIEMNETGLVELTQNEGLEVSGGMTYCDLADWLYARFRFAEAAWVCQFCV